MPELTRSTIATIAACVAISVGLTVLPRAAREQKIAKHTALVQAEIALSGGVSAESQQVLLRNRCVVCADYVDQVEAYALQLNNYVKLRKELNHE